MKPSLSSLVIPINNDRESRLHIRRTNGTSKLSWCGVRASQVHEKHLSCGSVLYERVKSPSSEWKSSNSAAVDRDTSSFKHVATVWICPVRCWTAIRKTHGVSRWRISLVMRSLIRGRTSGHTQSTIWSGIADRVLCWIPFEHQTFYTCEGSRSRMGSLRSYTKEKRFKLATLNAWWMPPLLIFER